VTWWHRAGLVLALCAAATGCGRADDRAAVGAVTERFLQAIAAEDGAGACAQLSDDTAQALQRDAGQPCAVAATGLDVALSTVTRSEVFGTAAKVDLADGGSAFLELTPDGWRISAAGCVPEPGEQPYTCEVEA
jgi:hypothetical protein